MTEVTHIVAWTLPVPSTALLDGGPVFEKCLGREVALRFSYESENDERRTSAVVFQGVEAFKCTYFHAQSTSMLVAYDTLVDLGESRWLEEIRTNLKRHDDEPHQLVHLMLGVDDGPTYEIVCQSFRVEEK